MDFLDRFSKQYSDIEFRENPSSGSRVVPCGWTDRHKLFVALHNFAEAPKIRIFHVSPHKMNSVHFPSRCHDARYDTPFSGNSKVHSGVSLTKARETVSLSNRSGERAGQEMSPYRLLCMEKSVRRRHDGQVSSDPRFSE